MRSGSRWCSATGGGGVGGTASDDDGGTVTLTLVTDDRVEGTIDFARGGRLTSRAPFAPQAPRPQGPGCCPR